MDRSEFEEISLQHLDSVYRMAMQLARHPDEAADLVQETYLKALKASGRFREQGGGMRPWLFKILHNVFYTRIAKKKRGPVSVDDLASSEGTEKMPDEPPVAWGLADLDWDHVDSRVKDAVTELRPEYQAVLLMWGVEGLKYREIAEIQNVPIGTVMSRLHRARAILADELAGLAEEFGWSRGSSSEGGNPPPEC